MPIIDSVGGSTTITALLHMDIDLEADGADKLVRENWSELQACWDAAAQSNDPDRGNNPTIVLPAGTIYASESYPDTTHSPVIKMDERHSGTTIRGAGPSSTVLIDPYKTAQPVIAINSRRKAVFLNPGVKFGNGADTVAAVDFDQCEVGEVLFFWKFNYGAERSPRQRSRITAKVSATQELEFTPALPNPNDPAYDSFIHVKGYEATGSLTVGATAYNTSGTLLGYIPIYSAES